MPDDVIEGAVLHMTVQRFSARVQPVPIRPHAVYIDKTWLLKNRNPAGGALIASMTFAALVSVDLGALRRRVWVVLERIWRWEKRGEEHLRSLNLLQIAACGLRLLAGGELHLHGP